MHHLTAPLRLKCQGLGDRVCAEYFAYDKRLTMYDLR